MKRADFYGIRIKENKFNDDGFCCLGKQLAQILTELKPALDECYWECMDIEYSNKVNIYSFDQKNGERKVIVFPDIEELIEQTKQVNQFSYGVFIAFPKNTNVSWEGLKMPYTENVEGIQHPLGVLEIRTFDFSAFEIYTKDVNIYDLLCEKYL